VKTQKQPINLLNESQWTSELARLQERMERIVALRRGQAEAVVINVRAYRVPARFVPASKRTIIRYKK